eukprot:334504-Alexandrium_andersonii.AAC.2
MLWPAGLPLGATGGAGWGPTRGMPAAWAGTAVAARVRACRLDGHGRRLLASLVLACPDQPGSPNACRALPHMAKAGQGCSLAGRRPSPPPRRPQREAPRVAQGRAG